MAYIRVVYRKKGFDYVSAGLLDALIRLNEVTHFYRPSEKKWISIKFDPIRGTGGFYRGPERRVELQKADAAGQKPAEERDPQWLENLWRHIGTL